VNVEELVELDDLRELAQLFLTIWERSSEPPINSDLLRALSHSGNYIAGARSDGRLVGGIVGWLGMHSSGEPHMHSHILGVLAGSEMRGLGFDLKQHQRSWCLRRGIRRVEWTFDPLVRRNAYFNLDKLGATAAEYLVDFYGAMHDGINAGDESDRILVRWDLEPARAAAALGAGGSAPRLLSAGESGEPVITPVEGPIAVCEVPDDIVGMRHARPDLAHRWRKALRSTLGAHLMSGGAVAGVTREGWYVLDRRPR
jgi:predicted GNAT superfamily acetyltransferase